jgi:hypothetical protein
MMKRTGFKKKAIKPMKRTVMKKISPNKIKKKTNKRMIYGQKVWSLKVADTYFSRWIREQKNYTCEMCGIRHEPPTKLIQCSHYIGRTNKATRFDPNNCDVLCATCHSIMEDLKQYDYRDWKIKQMGAEAHAALRLKGDTSLGEKDAIYNCMILLGKL